jgi:hypothetical protein
MMAERYRGLASGAALLGLALAAAGCGDNQGPEGGTSSFDRLQTAVFNARCVACHAPGSPLAAQSGLVLQAGVAYDALVGGTPRDADARNAGFKLVEPGSPDASLLLHKLRWDLPGSAAHFGQPMPLGGPPLTVGQVEFVRQWIAAGAPREGVVADIALLEDATPQQVTAFLPLAPPARGYQLHLDRFPVQPNSEREIYVYQRVGNAEEVWINRIEVSMRPSTHHFILYSLPPSTPSAAIPPHNEVRDLWRPDGTRNSNPSMFYRRYLGGRSYQFPDGVALRLPANTSLDLNSHYINGTAGIISGEVYANLHTVERGAVGHEAFALFLNNLTIHLPPRQRTTVSRTFTMSEPVRVFWLTSHMHAKGERFVIRITGGPRNGQVVYETNSWDYPDVIGYDPPLQLAAGEGLRSEVTYYNPTDQTVTFGLTSEDEMSIIIGYYYCPTACSAAFVEALEMTDAVLGAAPAHVH